jgi:putative flippase GtrA
MTPSQRGLAWFIAVGCTAAAVHFGAVVGLVQGLGMPPLVANVAGWLVALGVSTIGHLRLSFAHQQAPAARAARRFFAVSAIGFSVNEAVYATLLGWSGIGYRLALAVTLVAVAVGTYLLSRHWAFRGRPGSSR